MVIMVIEISDFLSRVEASQYSIFTQKFHSSVSKTLRKFNGSIKRKDNNNYLVSYQSVSDAIQCAIKIQYKFKYVTPKHKSFSRRLNIAICASDTLSKASITLATRMCEIVKDEVVISADVKNEYESTSENAVIDLELMRVLTLDEEQFLTKIMDYVELHWNKTEFNVSAFSKALGYTYAQLYGRLMKLTGKTPNNFIKEFRLHKALELLHIQNGSITQIAQQTGFNSATYFSECFLNKYKIRPSKYLQQHS